MLSLLLIYLLIQFYYTIDCNYFIEYKTICLIVIEFYGFHKSKLILIPVSCFQKLSK